MLIRFNTSWVLWILAGLIFSVTWEDASHAKIYKYRDPGGNWHYTDTAPEASSTEEVESAKTDAHPMSWDLNQYLQDKLPPGNALEKARNFTVTIKTPIGLGSGFFIHENGIIVTNRHVFEGDRNQITAATRLFKVETARLEKFKRDLLSVAADMMAFEGLGDDPHLAQSLNSGDPDEFIRLYKGIDRKDAAFTINSRRFDAMLKDFHEREEKLGKLQEYLHDSETRAANPPAYVTVLLADNTPFEAKFIARSLDHDLALFQLSGYITPRPEFSNIHRVPVGIRVYAIGSPMGLSHSVSEGIFSALRKDPHGALIIQSTVKVNKGNSGGPLIDEQGRVLGVNTAKVMRPGVEGISFSISIHTVMEAFKNDLK